MTMLFCNIGWMEKYDGLHLGDEIKNGGSFITENERGFEICNFSQSSDGRVFGYVQPTAGSKTVNLERIKENVNTDYIDGVTVVWVANRDGLGTVIVGWYNNARVYRYFQEFKGESDQHTYNEIDGYYITAKYEDAHLLEVDERVFKLPRGEKGGIGQSNIWYADQPLGQEFKQTVKKYISQTKDELDNKLKIRKNIDTIAKLKVEEIAINLVCAYYRNLGYMVESVEKDNLGYDLIATNKKINLLIEVKGLSGTTKQIGLSPNEYNYFQLKNENYRLIIINNALVEPIMTICRFSKEVDNWIVEGNNDYNLDIIPKTAAIISIN